MERDPLCAPRTKSYNLPPRPRATQRGFRPFPAKKGPHERGFLADGDTQRGCLTSCDMERHPFAPSPFSRSPQPFGVIIINARPGPSEEERADGYMGRAGIQYLNARSNTGDKGELRRAVSCARRVTISGRHSGQRASYAPPCARVYTRWPIFIARARARLLPRGCTPLPLPRSKPCTREEVDGGGGIPRFATRPINLAAALASR